MKSKKSNLEIKIDSGEDKFICEFCKKSFLRESSLINHVCEPKRRWMWKDDKYSMMAFRAYQIFYEFSMRSKKPKTQQDFIKSNYYTDFIKYGKYLVDINAIDPEGFTKFLIKMNVKLNMWTNEQNYNVWVTDLGKNEHPTKAFERTTKLMDEWAKENDKEWFNFFREVATPLATYWIVKGKIAPWVLFSIGHDLIDRLSDEQLLMIKGVIDTKFWSKKLLEYDSEIGNIRSSFEMAGV